MSLKFYKRSVMKFVSRAIQSRYIGIGNYPTCEAKWDYFKIPQSLLWGSYP